MGSLLLSLLTGSLAVALAALYRRSMAVLIIIACSCYLHCVCQLVQLFIIQANKPVFTVAIQVVLGLLQLITVGSAIEFFHFWISNIIPINDPIHQHMMLAFESSLLFLLLVNGLFLGICISSQEEYDSNQDLQDIHKVGKDIEATDVQFVPDDKFVPMKDSAQTLTPQMYNIQMAIDHSHYLFNDNNPEDIKSVLNQGKNIIGHNREWITNSRTQSKSSETNSNLSVIKHRLDGNSRTGSLKKTNINQKLRSSSFTSKKSSPSQSPLKGLQVFKFKSPKKFSFTQNRIDKNNEIQLRESQEKKPIGLNAKYLARLSTISDLHKSFINLLGTSNNSEEAINNIPNSESSNNIISKNYNNHKENETSPIGFHHNSFMEVSGQPLNQDSLKHYSPKLTEERIAVERINNALLPPCLQTHDTRAEHVNNNHNNKSDKDSDLIPTNSEDAPSFLIPEMSGEEASHVPPSIPLSKENPLAGLRDLSEVIDVNIASSEDYITPREDQKLFAYPPKISLDMWQNNRAAFMRKASEQSQNSQLMSPFKFNITTEQMQAINESPLLESKQHFNFPPQNNTEQGKTGKVENKIHDNHIPHLYTNEREISDTISELDKYLNNDDASGRDESQILEESLQQENTSTNNIILSPSERISHEFSRITTRHSPTKSLVSIISGSGANAGGMNTLYRQKSQNLAFGTPTHLRTNSQLLQYSFPRDVNISTQSSPTKQKFKRIGKKLSLSNISDNMFSDTESKYNHSRNQSVEFTYIHDLQNKRHSPSKSISVIPMTHISSHISNNSVSRQRVDIGYVSTESPKKKGDRRHSTAAVEKMIRSASSLFYKQSNVDIDMSLANDNANEFIFKQPVMENLVEERKVSNQTTVGSDNIYPDMVMSEYDREKWNAMKDRDIIDDEGHFKE